MHSINSNNREQTLVEKTIRLQNQSSPHQQILKVRFQYLPKTRQINLSKAIRDLISNGFPIQNSQLFYWDYDRKMFVYIGNFPSKDQHYLKYQNFQQNIIHIRYRKIARQQQNRHQFKREPQSKKQIKKHSRMQTERRQPKQRVKQRTIEEVIHLVSSWRNIYETVDSNGKKRFTLESAAKLIGVSKKTLDDYYLQLKLGETYHFDFESNNQAKIGILRAFVKSHHKKQKKQSPQAIKIEAIQAAIMDEEVASECSNSDSQESQPYLFHKDHSFDQDS